MSSLVAATSQLPLSKLDYWERLIRWEFAKALDATKPASWKFWVKRKRFLTWIDLSSFDGYKREKTIRTLSGAAPNSFFFALAMRRLNDWVPQVRSAAREQLPIIAKQSDPKHVVDVVCVVLSHWNSWGRLEDVDKQVILDIVCLREISQLLALRITSATAGPMSSILAQLGRIKILDTYLPEIAKNAVQPAVRAKAYRSLLEGKAVWFERREFEWTDIRYCEGRYQPVLSERDLSIKSPLLSTLKQASSDRSPMVRRVAGELLIRELPNIGGDAVDLARSLAGDASPSVAERGEFALKRLKV